MHRPRVHALLIGLLAASTGCVLPPLLAPSTDARPGWTTAPPPLDPPGSVAPVPSAHVRGALVVFLDGAAGRLVAGDRDDASRSVSSIVRDAGLPYYDVPAFEGTAAEWERMEGCIAGQFAGLPIELVRDRPRTGHFIRLVIGGGAAALGPTDRWGIAPTLAGAVTRWGVGFVFSADHTIPATRVTDLCQSAAHELGHMIGLEHTDDCTDLMGGVRTCPHVAFNPQSRARLEDSLRRWVELDTPLPERVTGLPGEDSSVTGLTIGSRGIERLTNSRAAEWTIAVRAPRPIKTATLRIVTPDRLRGEMHCGPASSACGFTGNLLVGRYLLATPGIYYLLAQVTYVDGETRSTSWMPTEFH